MYFSSLSSIMIKTAIKDIRYMCSLTVLISIISVIISIAVINFYPKSNYFTSVINHFDILVIMDNDCIF